MQPSSSLSSQSLSGLDQLANALSQCNTHQEKLALFAKKGWALPTSLCRRPWNAEQQVVLLALCAVGQVETLEISAAPVKHLEPMVNHLVQVERFYGFMGGIVGYHVTCLSLANRQSESKPRGVYHQPIAHDISADTVENRRFRMQALRHLDQLAEIYPAGGAADRLSSLTSQIAATRMFCEQSLLERLIDDVQAKESLARRLLGKAVTIPIVLMTSDEKEGHRKIWELLEERRWFGRDPDSFFFVTQPRVPAMDLGGRWIATSPGNLLLKPGGHGVLWKVCRDQGALQWLKNRGKSKVLIRQINNPIAGVDDGVLTFIGYGMDRKKGFGFAACPRMPDVAEGVNVVMETDRGFLLTNIEYCDFEHNRVDSDAGLLANTNLLFAEIETIEELLEDIPLPGMLVNPKEVAVCLDELDAPRKVVIRLESTMQNLADGLLSSQLPTRAYITTNRRQKTISPIKRENREGRISYHTPEQCLCDMQLNAQELLERCRMEVGEDVLFEYHPCLGPLYEIIAQKVRGGVLKKGSHLQLFLAEVDLRGLCLDGALRVEAACLQPGKGEGRCHLDRVRVVNRGLKRKKISSLASSSRVYSQRCHIMIEEGGAFEASQVVFEGNYDIRVPAFTRVKAVEERGKLKFLTAPAHRPLWRWKYTLDRAYQINIEKKREHL